jgi:RHS repeat-associated protein
MAKGRQTLARRIRTSRSIRRSPRPGVEVLERRQLLSVVNWISSSSGDWNTPGDWSTGKVPGPGDDVSINPVMGATPIVTISSGDTESVNSITASDPLSITGGSLTVAANSTIGGGLSMTGGSLEANGSGISLTVSGTTTVSGASLYAAGGATLSLPQLASYTEPYAFSSSTMEATGTGSVLSLPALTSIAVTAGYTTTYVEALSGGDVELPVVTQITGSVELETNSTASTLNLSRLTTFTGGILNDPGGNLMLPLLSDADDSTFEISGGVTLSLPTVTSADAASFEVSGGSSLTLAGLTSYTEPNSFSSSTLEATGTGSVLSLPALTSIAVTAGYTTTYVEALLGGDVELPVVTQITGSVELESNSASSTLNVTDLTTFTGGTLNDSAGNLEIPVLADVNDTTLEISGGLTLSLPTVTSADAASFEVSGGSSLTLAGLTSYTEPNSFSSSTLEATGTGSVLSLPALTSIAVTAGYTTTYVEALLGGDVELPLVTQSTGSVELETNSTASTLNLSRLTTFTGGTLNDPGFNLMLPLLSDADDSTFEISGGVTLSLPTVTSADAANFEVSGGSSLTLAGLTSYTEPNSFSSSTLEATGTGSVLSLPSLSSIAVTAGYTTTYVEALLGGDVELPVVTQITGSVELESNSASSTLNVTDLTTFTGGELAYSGGTLTYSGGTQPMPALADANNTTFQISGGVALALPTVTSANAANFEVSGGSSLTLTGLTSYTEPNSFSSSTLESSGADSVLSLPALTSIAVTAGYTTTYVNALSGGDVELPSVTQLSGSIDVESENAGSTIDLSSLTDFNGGSLTVTGQGTALDADLVTLNGVSVTLAGTGALATAQWATLTDGSITITGGSYTFAGLTDVNGSSLYAQANTSLALPNVTSYTEPNFDTSSTFQASGADSVLSLLALTSIATTASFATIYVQALSGGDVELPSVTQLSGSIDVESENAGSTIDLSSLTGFNGGALTVTGQGTVLAPGLTSLNGVGVTLDGTGTLATAQWATLTDGSITIAGGSYTFAGLTDVNGSSLYAQASTSLALPNVTSYTEPNFDTSSTFQASGADSVLSLLALTSIATTASFATTYVEALSGGDVELPLVTQLSGSIDVESENAGSTIDLSSLTGFNGGSLTVTGQGTVLAPSLTTLNGVGVTLDGTGTLATAQWATLTDGSITITSGSYTFAGLTDVNGSSLYAQANTSLALPNVTSYTEPNFDTSSTFQASGADSVLSLPALTSIATTASFATTYVEALSGGDVELPLLTQLSGSIDVESENAGSTIELTSLTSFNGGSLTITQGGTVLAPNLTTLVNVTITTDSTGTFTLPANRLFSFPSGTSTFETDTLLDEGDLDLGRTEDFALAEYPGGGTGIISLTNYPAGTGVIASPFDIPVNITDPTTVYTLINSVWGEYGDTVGSVEFKASGGLDYSVNLVEGQDIRDFNNDGYNNTIGQGALGGTYLGSVYYGGGQSRLDEQGFVLPTAFQSATLTDIILHATGNDPDGIPFLAAATVATSNGQIQVGINSLVNANLQTYANGTNYPQGGTDVTTGGATVNVQGGLTINGLGGLSVSTNSILEVSGNLLGNTTNAAGFNPLGTVVLDSANGTNNAPQLLEAMSQDLGNVAAGFNDNFAYGILELTANTYVELVDNAANSPGDTPEALYVKDLIVPAGATLNLDGLHLYVQTEQINGTIVAGGAVVSGEVYDDVNDNGTLDSGEPGLVGWTVDLTNTATSSTYTTTTDANGLFSLSGIAAGTYTLSEVVQPGFVQTQPASPGTDTLTVASGQTVTGEEFGEYPTAAIGGTVFLDTNGNGVLDNGEAGLSGWTVQLLNSSNAVIATATTSSGGNYAFGSLLPGTYTVQVVEKSGYVASSTASVTIADDNGKADTVNFGEFVPVMVSGEVFNDPTDSGTFVSGDTGLSGWTVELVQGSQVLRATSGSGGLFSFSNVGPGSYILEVVQQTGWVATNSPVAIAPTSGTNISGEYLGEFQSLTISGLVFDDVAGNGTYASGDQGLSGWTVDLLNSVHSVVASAQTDANGNYSLTGVVPGTYTVEEVPQSGSIQTTAPAVYDVTVVQGENPTGLNFGDFQLATVSGELFDDVKDHGALDPGDAGLAGWTIDLFNGASKVVATTTTGSNGDYAFTGVGPGTYSIAEVLQPGYLQTAPSSGGLTVTTSSGATLTAEDFGVFKVVSLEVSGVATTPASGLQSGSNLVVQWTDTNTGTLPASGSFSDQVVITNTTTGDVLATGYVPYNAASQGNLAAGASVAQQFAFSLPNGYPGAGQIQFAVTADYDQNVSTPAGEPNDTATLTETSTLASYPELVTSDVTAPASADPGQPISVDWKLANDGSGTASGPWTEQVLLATDSNGDNPTLAEVQTFTGSLSAGQSISDSADVRIPSLAPGNYWIVVNENPLGELFELDTANNTVVAAQPTSIAGGLTLTLASDTASNAAGPNATTATVTRNTDTTNALQVTITNSDPNDVAAPTSVTIPAGATSVTFSVGTINNHVVEGTQIATLTASATGEASGSDRLTVTDTNVPALTVVLDSQMVNESDSNPASYGTVTRNTPTTSALTVSLLSDEINKLTVPATVTIAAGATSATFPVTVVNDDQIDGDETATITASASGFQSGSDSAVVVDDNVPTLSLTLAQTTVSEAAGADATTGTVSIASPASEPLTIVLGSSDTSAATVPASVVIDAGQESASFSIAAVNSGQDVGNQTAVITANVETYAGVVVTQGSAEASLLLLNANGPALSLSFATSTVVEGSTATATVTRNTDTSNSLVVTLSSSNPNEATVQPTVTIPPGQASVTFAVDAVQNGVSEGLQQVQISATTAGLDTGIATLGITDVELPDLVVSNVTAPATGYDNTPLTISWTITNDGDYPASGSWVDQVDLDPAGGPQSTTPVDSVTFTGTVKAGQSYTQTDTIPAPSAVGQYFVRVVTDSGRSVQELDFNNNTGIAAQPYNDQAAYTATVTPSATTVTAGTPVVLSGAATMTSDGDPAADVPVAVQILVAGTTRTLTGTTNASGDYSVTFQPLPDEAGNYSVTAADPDVTNPAVQAQFTIVGMTASPSTAKVTVVPNTPLTGTFTLTNLSDVTLSGLTATARGGPLGLTVQLTPPTQIAGDGSATLGYSLDDSSTQANSGVVTIQVTTTQGADLTILLGVSVDPLTPVLAANPGYLDSGMVVGAQTLVSFTVVNNGGAPSGNLQVKLPATPYMSLASPATIPSLAPGASSTVTVELTPPSNLPLEEYQGTIDVSGSQTGIGVPFTFTAITTATGTVQVLVDDNYTFEEAGSPRVQGATVNLLNPYDNTDIVETGTTDASGSVTFTKVPAGPYDLQVQATGHSSYENSFTVVPGITNSDEVFIAEQFVTYTWNVVQTTIQDTYQIQLQTTFATDVPAPVVTITAPSTIPTLVPGQSWSFDATITNHGLIAAQGVTLTMPTDPEYTFTALSTDIGVLPAESSVQVPITVTRVAPQSLSLSDGGTTFTANVVVPNPVNSDTASTVYVDYSNTGTVAIPAPILVLTATQGSSQGAFLSLDSTLAGLAYDSNNTPAGFDNAVQFLASGATPGMIEPGESVKVPVYYAGWLSSQWSNGPVTFSLTEVSADNNDAIDWSSVAPGLQLGSINDAAWSAIAPIVATQMGSTWGQYVQTLDDDAAYLAGIGEPTTDLNQLLSFEIEKANAGFVSQTLASVTADDLPAPGMDLSFVQSYQASISGRYTQGILGDGWTTNWDISASTMANGDVVVNDDGTYSYFSLQPGGTFAPEAGDAGTTLTVSGGACRLLAADGTIYQFNTNGTLDHVQDVHGNRITAGYNSEGQLVSLTDSNGEYLDLTYNAQGDLAMLTDSNGQTETYGYDPSGQFLTSFTDAFGTTNYSYVTGQSAAQDNALATITNAAGTELFYDYDDDGRLVDEHENGDAENVTIAYLSPGGYVTTDADGNQTTDYYDLYGAPAVTVDPLGNVTRYSYDSDLNLTQVNGPDDTTYTYTYDADGNLTSETDPLGQTTTYTYNATNDLTSYTDAKGNTTSYAYDSQNDPLSITYANGTQQSFSYNPLGEATSFLNADGDAIGFTYNAQGLIATESFADGTSYNYTYNVQGNMTSATDAQGDVETFVYGDSSNPALLTEVEYPGGTWLKFSYNVVGERVQSVDQTGFTVDYSYDTLGRLSKLTDGNGNLIVQYTYDAAGNLIQKDNGNGTFTVYTYNGDDNVLSITNYAPSTGSTSYVVAKSAVNSFDVYTYDALGNMLTDTSQDGEWVYSYDGDGQLIQAIFTPNSTDPDGLASQDLQYAYDAVGNRISETVNGVTTTYVTNNVNQYTSSTTNGVTTSYQYDADGNLISQNVGGSTTTYTYNELNQLTAVNGPGLTASYGYDPIGDRITQTVNGATTNFEIDPAGLGDVVATFNASGALEAHFAYGLGLVSEVSAGGVAGYYDFNNIGSVIGITGTTGSYVNKYTYLPFGQTVTVAAIVANPFTFVGQSGVMNAGGELLSMRNRWYDPTMGRFIQRDPLNIGGGDPNLATYADNDPVSETDPAGLSPSIFDWWDWFKEGKEFLEGDCDKKFEVAGKVAGDQIGDKLGGLLGGALGAAAGFVIDIGLDISVTVVGVVTGPGEILIVIAELDADVVVEVTSEKIGEFLGGKAGGFLGGALGGAIGGAIGKLVCPCECPPKKPPTPPSGPCAILIGLEAYYICDNTQVGIGAAAAFSVPGVFCTAIGIAGELAGGLGGGGIPPEISGSFNCNPAINTLLQATQQAGNDAGDPPIDTTPPVTGTDQAANAVGTNGNVSPLTFLATALGNLGLINGQSGNDGDTPAEAAQMVSTIATFDQVEADLAGILATASGQGASLGITGDIALLQQVDARLGAVTTAENLLFGGDANWLDTNQSATLQQWMTDFFTDAQNSSGGGQISPVEMTQLLATTLPNSVSTSEATEFIDRWNRTVQYWSQGIFTAAQVPTGQSTDFLDLGAIQTAFNTAFTAEQESQVNGYSDVGTEVQGALAQVKSDLQGQGTCATIKLQIDQSATLTRSAFSGTLSITNSEGTGAMTNVTMDINITDAEGNPANGEFFISSPSYSGAFSVVNGIATLPDFSTGTIAFTFIPDDSAAANGPTQYMIGGTIGFTDPSGGAVSIPVFPSTITVDPQAELQLNYFLQTDVIGEDPFTPQDVIPSEPAVLGLLVTNVGGGTANNLSITTAQPQILQNAKGLLDTFQIIGTQVGNQQETPSLTVDFGDIAPGQTADASFLILSSLEGLFENFTATFSHSDALGGTETSLISSVVTHSLVHAGDFNYPDSTGATDYLVDDNPNPQQLPDTIYFSDGTTAAVNIATDATSSPVGPSSALTFQVTADVTSGWDYIQLPDPGAGYTLYKVVRSDGTVIPVSDQAWTTDRTISPTGRSTVDYELHVLDDNSTGSYLVYYKPTTSTPPVVSVLSTVSSPQSGPVGSIDVTFSEPINPSTFTTANLSLTLNDGPNLINSYVTIAQDSPTTYTIGGLSALTAGDGNYTLTVDATGISDFFGDVGSGSQSTSWATGTDVPVIVSVGAGNPTLRNTPVDTVDVVLSEPIVPGSFDDQALSLTLDGGPNLITSGVTVTEIDPTTYQIGGLGTLTIADGDYDLTVTAGGLVDGSGNPGVGLLSEVWMMNTVGPTVASLPTYIQSPRNIVVPEIDVIFSEPIVPSTLTYQNLAYSKPGGPNLITPDITITQLSPTEFAISNFNNLLLPIDGTYTFTISAVGVMDLAGNTGTGSASETWVLDTSPPGAPTDLAIAPNTGVTPGLTDTGAVTLTGTLPESGLAVDVMDGNTDLGFATVNGTTFSIAISLPNGANALEVTADDAAGNVSPSATLNVFVDQTPPQISSVAAVTPNPRNTPVGSVDITFSKAINLSTFTTADISLTDNGGTTNLITSAVTINLVSGSTYEIGGLSGLTTAEGTYTLTVNASGIQDQVGNFGTGSMSASWLTDTTPPTSTVGTLPSQTTSTSFVVSASATDPNGSNGSAPSGIASIVLYVSEDGGAFTPFATVTPAKPFTLFTGQAGHTYGFYSVATDKAGNVQPTPSAAQATVEIVSPLTITSIAAVSPNPRNQAVSAIDVTFSIPINTSSLAPGALTLTDNGGANLINRGVSLSLVGGTTATYAIEGLAGLTTAQGLYALTVNADDIPDQNGNLGSGTLSTSWLMDTTPPTSTVSPLPKVGSRLVFPVTVTGTVPSEPAGSPTVDITSFAVYVSTNGGAWTLWQTLTPSTGTPNTASANFTGTSNTVYAFYSVATDNAGNTQADKPSVEASTDLPNLNTPVTQVTASSTYNGDGTFTLSLSGTDAEGSGLAYFEVYVAIGAGTPVLIGPAIPAGVANSSGTYHATTTYVMPSGDYGPSYSYGFSSVGIDVAGIEEPTHAMYDVRFNESYSEPSAANLAVSSLTVENGAAERSYIRYLDVNFNDATNSTLQAIVNSVNDPTDYGPAELTLTQYGLNGSGTATPISLQGLLDVIDNAIEVDFGAGGIGGNPGSTAADGYYALSFTPQSGQGRAATHHFYRLLGDVNGDGTVDQNDLTEIAAARGQSLSQIATAIGQPATGLTALSMDVNGDGSVNTTDLALATKSKGRSIASNLPEG